MGVTLRPFRHDDIDFAYLLATETECDWLRIGARGVDGPLVFAERLWRTVVAQFVAEDEQGRALGVGAAFEHSERSRTCAIDAAVLPGIPGASDAEAEILDALLDHCFSAMLVRKVQVRTVEWAPPNIAPSRNAVLEGTLRGHLVSQGQSWDVHVRSVWNAPTSSGRHLGEEV